MIVELLNSSASYEIGHFDSTDPYGTIKILRAVNAWLENPTNADQLFDFICEIRVNGQLVFKLRRFADAWVPILGWSI